MATIAKRAGSWNDQVWKSIWRHQRGRAKPRSTEAVHCGEPTNVTSIRGDIFGPEEKSIPERFTKPYVGRRLSAITRK